MKIERLKFLVDKLMEQAKTNLVRDGWLVPVVTFVKGTNLHTRDIDLSNDLAKEVTATKIKVAADLIKPDAVAMVSEGWMVMRDSAKEVAAVAERVKDEPDARKCISVEAVCDSGFAAKVTFFRHEGGKIVLEEEHTFRRDVGHNRYLDGIFKSSEVVH